MLPLKIGASLAIVSAFDKFISYLNRNRHFVACFSEGNGRRNLFAPPQGDEDHPDLQLGFMYRRADYDTEITEHEEWAARPVRSLIAGSEWVDSRDGRGP